MRLARQLKLALVLCMLMILTAGGLWAQQNLGADWKIVDEGDKEAPSVWSGNANLITQSSNIYGGFDTDITKPGTYAVIGDSRWGDYTVTLDMRSQDNDGIGVIFRYRDNNNYYRFSMDRQRSYRRLVRKVAGQMMVLAEDAFVYVQDKWYQVKIVAVRDRIQIYLDGKMVFDVRDGALPLGKIGLYCWGNAGSEFAALTVRGGQGVLFSQAAAAPMTARGGTMAAGVPPATATKPVMPPGTADDTYRPLLAVVAPTDGPTFQTNGATINVSGIAHDDVALTRITWKSSSGASGVAQGTERWTVNNLPLQPGENRITFTAEDAAGNLEEKQLVVTSLSTEKAAETTNTESAAAMPPTPSMPSTPPLPAVPAKPPEMMAATPMLESSKYLIGAGDVLDVSVWKDPALSKVVTVLPDGTISLPLVGEMRAVGKTVPQLQAELESKIAPYVPSPTVTVIVSQANSMIIYVLGKVNNPGRFPLVGNVDVLQALSMAGGLNPFAKANKIKIFRKSGADTKIFEFKYEEAVRGEALKQNIELVKGDIVVVP